MRGRDTGLPAVHDGWRVAGRAAACAMELADVADGTDGSGAGDFAIGSGAGGGEEAGIAAAAGGSGAGTGVCLGGAAGVAVAVWCCPRDAGRAPDESDWMVSLPGSWGARKLTCERGGLAAVLLSVVPAVAGALAERVVAGFTGRVAAWAERVAGGVT